MDYCSDKGTILVHHTFRDYGQNMYNSGLLRLEVKLDTFYYGSPRNQ